MKIKVFTFNDFAENTYVLYDKSKECLIIDPGCNSTGECNELSNFIENNELVPVGLVNTHCHIDHVLGNSFVSKKYSLELESHRGEEVVLNNMEGIAQMYGIPYKASPRITKFLDEGDLRTFGDSQLEVLYTPGHSPASISFFHRESKQLIAGDVLFQRSIGRTDLPGGNFDTLISSIRNKFFPLGDDVIVYPGHGPSTTIGEERRLNQFLV